MTKNKELEYEAFEAHLYDFADAFKIERNKDMVRLCREYIDMHWITKGDKP